jgi:hypothetical protein
MADSETMSRTEIMRAIHEGDRHAGVLFEEMNGKFDTLIETYDLLDNKIDRVDTNLEEFRRETNYNINLLFEENRKFFGELRALRAEFKGEMSAMREEFSQRMDRMEGGMGRMESRLATLGT